MKRAIELEERVAEIVHQARLRDANGNFVNQELMTEPLLLGLLGAPEALFQALRDRPIVVLNMLQTNKAFKKFWKNFNDIWILLSESLIEKEWPVEGSADFYSFFVITNQRIDERNALLYPRRKPQPKPTSGFLKSNRYNDTRFLEPATTVGLDREAKLNKYGIY